jgi:hypothetical protein
MTRERAKRYQSAAEMGSDLRAYLEGRLTAAADIVSATSADERLLAIGLTSGGISVIDVRTGETTRMIDRHASPVISLRFREDGGLQVEWKDGRSDHLRLPAQS